MSAAAAPELCYSCKTAHAVEGRRSCLPCYIDSTKEAILNYEELAMTHLKLVRLAPTEAQRLESMADYNRVFIEIRRLRDKCRELERGVWADTPKRKGRKRGILS